MNQKQIISSLLQYHHDFGVDHILNDGTRDHYKPTPRIALDLSKIKAAAPIATLAPITPLAVPAVSAATATSVPTATSAAPIIASALNVSSPLKPVSKPVSAENNQTAEACRTLEDLRNTLENSTGCDLIKSATNTVFASGDPTSQIMFIGEAPGIEEDLAGQPFVGQSGQLLDAILSSINLNREQIYIANIIPWRPPGNRPPTATELSYCLPFIERHIALIKPKVIVLLGGVATKALLRRNDGILKLRGHTYHYEGGIGATDTPTGILAIPTFHPAYIMRSPSQKAHVWRDMLSLKAMLETMQAEDEAKAA